MISTVEEATSKVRDCLRDQRGNWLRILRHILKRNPKSQITYRWLVAFAAKQDREPKFSKVIELGAALGLDIYPVVNHAEYPRYTEANHAISRAPRKRNRSANVARRSG